MSVRPALRAVAAMAARHPLVVLALLGLVARVLAHLALPVPAYPDSEYYAAVAREVAAGHGLSVPYLWAFVEVGGVVPAHGVLPVPANAHWMPLASLVQVPFLWALPSTPDLASALPFLLLGALPGPLAWLLARELLPGRCSPTLAGVIGSVPVGLAVLLGQPDNHVLFGAIATLVLLLASRAFRADPAHPRRDLALAGALSGLGYLARTDGMLLLGGLWVTALLLALVDRRAGRSNRFPLVGLLAASAAAAIVVAPWAVRQLATFGSLAPSAGSGRILWIRSYLELFGADGPLAPSHLLGDPAALLASRAQGLVDLVVLAVFGVIGFHLVPFVVAGGVAERRTRALAPFAVHAAVFGAWSVLVAAPHLPYGNLGHSALALYPAAAVLAARGLWALPGWVASRRPTYDADRGRRLWGRAIAAATLGLGVVLSRSTIAYLDDLDATHRAAAAVILADGGGTVMAAEPGAFWLRAGLPAVPTPASDLTVVERALATYGVRHLVLVRASLVPSLVPLWDGTLRPAWVTGDPVPIGDPAHPDALVFRIRPSTS